MKLSVIIPVYNEINTIKEIIRRVIDVDIEKEIIVVDDGSTDGTREYLTTLKKNEIKIIFHEKNLGKGSAVQTGFKYVTGDIVIIQDADLEYFPEEYPILIELILKGKADVVYGSRFLGRHRVFMFSHYLGNKLINLVANILYNTTLTDLETCYKAFRANVIKNIKLESNSFGIEAEITAKIFKNNLKIYEVPISYDGRTYSEGKKVRWRDGIIALFWLIKCKFQSVDIEKKTLFTMEKVKNYNSWIVSKIKPFIGKRILEIGSGIGNITKFLLSNEVVVATDVRDEYINILKQRFIENDKLLIFKYDVTNSDTDLIKKNNIDTIVCINVLEHVQDDVKGLVNLNNIIKIGDKLIILVPAIEKLYGSLDKNLGHYRRYNKEELIKKINLAGFDIENLYFFNIFGIVGWFLNSIILKRRVLSGIQTLFFDKLVPVLEKIESIINIPFGLSLIAICKKERTII